MAKPYNWAYLTTAQTSASRGGGFTQKDLREYLHGIPVLFWPSIYVGHYNVSVPIERLREAKRAIRDIERYL